MSRRPPGGNPEPRRRSTAACSSRYTPATDGYALTLSRKPTGLGSPGTPRAYAVALKIEPAGRFTGSRMR